MKKGVVGKLTELELSDCQDRWDRSTGAIGANEGGELFISETRSPEQIHARALAPKPTR